MERRPRAVAVAHHPGNVAVRRATTQLSAWLCDSVVSWRPAKNLLAAATIFVCRQHDRRLMPYGRVEGAIEQLNIPPDRSFSYDGRFIISRVTDKDGNVVRELRYDAGLADWVPMPIKHGTRKGGIRVVIRFTPVAGSPRNNEMFDVAPSDADAVTAWLDRLVRRH